MKIKKSLCMMSLVFMFTSLSPLMKSVATETSREAKEAAIQQIIDEVRESRYNSWYNHIPGKLVFKAKWDRRSLRVRFEESSPEQMDQALGMAHMPIYEQDQIINARNLALASISAGGIIYFIPQTDSIFWEVNEEDHDLTDSLRRDRLWTNPILGNLLSNFLSHAQKELEREEAMSKKPSRLRSFLMMILNPAGAFARQVNKIVDEKYLVSGSTDILTESPVFFEEETPRWDERNQTNYIGLRFTVHF